MSDTFDWAGLAYSTHVRWRDNTDAAAAYLRTRIEAAFVPVEDVTAERGRMVDRIEEWERQIAEATARAEAAEARVAELTTQLAEARESERAAMTEVNGLKDALAQVPEFICRKCGRRQDGPTDNEARF